MENNLLGLFLSLIYIKFLPRGLHAYSKLFADDASLFRLVDDIDESASKLNNDLIRLQEWTSLHKK